MAARFWVGGTGNWDAADTTHWAASSGGGGGSSVPGASDDVTFDGSSGGGTVTVTASVGVISITSGAHTGTLDTNGQTITLSGTWNGSGTATRTLTLGASAISVATWTFTTTTNLTLNANTSTITQTAATTFAGGAKTYATVVFTGTGPTITGVNTFGTLTRTGTAAKTDTLTLGANQTVSGTFTANGNSSINRLLIRSDTRGTARTITAATVTVTNADFQDITGAGAGSWNLSGITGGSGDCGGNTSITFTTAANQYWQHGASASYNWSDSTRWFLATNGGGGAGRVPLPQDAAFFDANSFAAGSKTVAQDMPRIGSMDWSGVTNSPAMSRIATSFFGSLTYGTMAFAGGAGQWMYEGRGSSILTTNGLSWGIGIISINAPGGTLTLGSAFTNTTNFIMTSGTFADGGFSVTIGNFGDSGTAARAIVCSGNMTSTADSTNVFYLTSTNLTVTFTGTLRFTNVMAAARYYYFAGKTFGRIEFATTGAFDHNIPTVPVVTGAWHMDASVASRAFKFTAGQNLSVGDMTRDAGTNVITLGSFTAASHTLTKTGGGTITMDYMSISRSTATPGSTWYATHSTDSGNNSGWTFAQSMTADAGSFTVTGQAVNLNLTYYLALAAGSFTVNGQAVNLSVAQAANTITAEAGAIVVTGQAVNFTIYTTMGVSPGVFTVVGQDVRFVVGRDSIQVEGIAFAKPGTLTPEFATPGAVSVSLDTPGASGAAWENL